MPRPGADHDEKTCYYEFVLTAICWSIQGEMTSTPSIEVAAAAAAGAGDEASVSEVRSITASSSSMSTRSPEGLDVGGFHHAMDGVLLLVFDDLVLLLFQNELRKALRQASCCKK